MAETNEEKKEEEIFNIEITINDINVKQIPLDIERKNVVTIKNYDFEISE